MAPPVKKGSGGGGKKGAALTPLQVMGVVLVACVAIGAGLFMRWSPNDFRDACV